MRVVKEQKWRGFGDSVKERMKHIQMPHTYVLLTGILLLVVALTYVIPAGEYTRVFDPVSQKQVVDASSFHFVEGSRPGFFGIFLALQRGYVDAANILFLIIFAYGYVYMLIDNGTLNALIGGLIRALGEKTFLIIPVGMACFGILGSTMGIFEEVYGMVPVFAGIAVALGYDIIVGGAIVFVGVATGFAAATLNPFSVGIAQSIAGVPMFSELTFHTIVFITFQTVAIFYVMWYAKRVKKDPKHSVLYGEQLDGLPSHELTREPMTGRQKICLALFLFTMGMLLYGTTKLGWYIDEIAAMFLMMMIVTGVAGGYGATKICKTFIESTKGMISSVLVVGFTRGIFLVMQDAMIADTIVYGLSSLLHDKSPMLSSVGMLMMQNVINFFITGSSSQAAITMPIMTPVADLVGISRQTAVLAYMFGDGFSDMFWPTACALECGLMGIPLGKWYKFMTPLFLIMMVLQTMFIIISVHIFA